MSQTGPEVIGKVLDELDAAIAQDRRSELKPENEHVVEFIALMCGEARKHYKSGHYVIAAMQTGAARGIAVQIKLLSNDLLESDHTAPATG